MKTTNIDNASSTLKLECGCEIITEYKNGKENVFFKGCPDLYKCRIIGRNSCLR